MTEDDFKYYFPQGTCILMRTQPLSHKDHLVMIVTEDSGSLFEPRRRVGRPPRSLSGTSGGLAALLRVRPLRLSVQAAGQAVGRAWPARLQTLALASTPSTAFCTWSWRFLKER